MEAEPEVEQVMKECVVCSSMMKVNYSELKDIKGARYSVCVFCTIHRLIYHK